MSTAGEPTNDQFNALFHTHVRAIQAYVSGHYRGADADDIVSQTFGVAWRRWSEMPAGHERPWLIVVARNFIHSAARTTRRRVAVIDTLNASRPQVSTDLAGDGLLAEDLEPMQRAFKAISESDREILLLAAWEDLNGADLGAVLGIPGGQGHHAAPSRAATSP